MKASSSAKNRQQGSPKQDDRAAGSGGPPNSAGPQLGNRATAAVFEEAIGPAGDPFEQEADRVADAVSSGGVAGEFSARNGSAANTIQRKCAECTKEEEGKIRRAPNEGMADSAVATADSAVSESKPAETAAPAQAMPEAPSRTGAGADAGAVLLVEDSESPGPNQMRRSEFLGAVRVQVCASADEALAAAGRDTSGCPWVDHWFAYYERRNATHVERALRRYAPEASEATSAADYIGIVTARVRRSVELWARTGEITGVPEDLPSAQPGGEVLNKFGGMFFKGRAVPRQANPISVRTQLGSGQPLPGTVQRRMESAFGSDFSGVRIHADPTGAQLSSQLNARAFTIGPDIAFGESEFRPGTIAGDALLAHELAHVVQQGGSVEPAKEPVENDSTLEKDADESAFGAVASIWSELPGRVAPAIRSGLRLQRCKTERDKEVERLGALQYGYLEEKRKKEEERLRKEAEEEAKKKGLEPPKAPPKVDIGDVIKKDEEQHALKGSPTAEWDNADQPAWKARAAAAWASVVASVKGTELESVAKGVKFNFDPAAALKGGFYASQSDHTLTVGMSWVSFAEQDPKNVWENLAHEMAGHFEYGKTYASEIMDAALSKLSSDERKRVIGDPQKFFETYEYPETEIYASLWQRRYRVPVSGAERPSGGIHPDANILRRLNVMKDALHPEVAKAVLIELKKRVDANPQILQRDKDFFVAKVKEVFGYTL